MKDDNSAFAGHGEDEQQKHPTDIKQDNSNFDANSNEDEKKRQEEALKKYNLDNSSNKNSKKSTPNNKNGRILLIIIAIISALFIFFYIRILTEGQNQVRQVRTAQQNKINEAANKNPDLKSALEKAKKDTGADKANLANNENNSTKDKKTEIKKELDQYTIINNSNTLAMLKLHGAAVNANQTKNGTDFSNALNDIQNDVNKNNNLLASVKSDGIFADLYNITNKKNKVILNCVEKEADLKSVTLIGNLFNSTAKKVNSYNQDYLTSFKKVLNHYHIDYTIDENGNFDY